MGRKRIDVYDNKVDLVWGNQTKTVFIKDIITVEYAPCRFADGHLYIRTARDTVGTSDEELDKVFSHMQPGVTFRKSGNEMALKIKDYLDKRIEECANESKQIVYQASPADELKKYKELLDSGIITQEEFNAKKKQILGL